MAEHNDPGPNEAPSHVALVGSLPEEQALPVLRGLWNNAGLEEAVLPVVVWAHVVWVAAVGILSRSEDRTTIAIT